MTDNQEPVLENEQPIEENPLEQLEDKPTEEGEPSEDSEKPTEEEEPSEDGGDAEEQGETEEMSPEVSALRDRCLEAGVDLDAIEAKFLSGDEITDADVQAIADQADNKFTFAEIKANLKGNQANVQEAIAAHKANLDESAGGSIEELVEWAAANIPEESHKTFNDRLAGDDIDKQLEAAAQLRLIRDLAEKKTPPTSKDLPPTKGGSEPKPRAKGFSQEDITKGNELFARLPNPALRSNVLYELRGTGSEEYTKEQVEYALKKHKGLL